MRLSSLAPALTLALSLAACGGDDGGGATIDAAPAPSSVTVMGTANTVMGTSQVFLAGATIEAFDSGGGAALATTTSSATDGTYSLTLTTTGTAINGYLKGTSAGRLDTYLYPPRPISANIAGATMLIINQQTFNLLSSLGGVTQDAAKGFVGVVVRDAAGTPVAGATVTIAPMGTAKIIYAVNSLPNGNATMTDAAGLVYIANTNVGEVTIDAAGAGVSYREHAVNARAGVVTTTAVEP